MKPLSSLNWGDLGNHPAIPHNFSSLVSPTAGTLTSLPGQGGVLSLNMRSESGDILLLILIEIQTVQHWSSKGAHLCCVQGQTRLVTNSVLRVIGTTITCDVRIVVKALEIFHRLPWWAFSRTKICITQARKRILSANKILFMKERKAARGGGKWCTHISSFASTTTIPFPFWRQQRVKLMSNAQVFSIVCSALW